MIRKVNEITRNQGVTKRCRLSWLTNSGGLVYDPIPNAGWGRELRSLSQWEHLYTWSSHKLWRSNSLFNLCSQLFNSKILEWTICDAQGLLPTQVCHKKTKILEITQSHHVLLTKCPALRRGPAEQSADPAQLMTWSPCLQYRGRSREAHTEVRQGQTVHCVLYT